MRMSKKSRTLVGLVAGAGAIASIGAVLDTQAASARARGGTFKVVDCNVKGLDDVFQNGIIELVFTSDVDPSTVRPALFQVRERNATARGGFATQKSAISSLMGSNASALVRRKHIIPSIRFGTSGVTASGRSRTKRSSPRVVQSQQTACCESRMQPPRFLLTCGHPW